MSLRVCSVAGCPELQHESRCLAHRPHSAARGYGHEHQKARASWLPLVKAGGVTCWRCTEPIEPDEPWDLGHDDVDREQYRGPEHRGCNRSTAGRMTV